MKTLQITHVHNNSYIAVLDGEEAHIESDSVQNLVDKSHAVFGYDKDNVIIDFDQG